MKVNITGSTGFVGTNLTKHFHLQNINVKGVSLRNVDWKEKLDKQAVALIHLAGIVHDIKNIYTKEDYFKINCDLTIELFQEFLNSDIKDFFFFSSVKAISDSVENVLTEEYEGLPNTLFGKSKLEAETYLLNQQLPEGKRLFIIRPCMIHGPGNKGNLNLLYKLVEKGIPWPLAAFENQRSFLSIDNLSFLVHQMLQNESVPSGIYNFADDNTVSTNELIRIISKTLGRQPKLWNINAGFIKSMVKIGDVLPLPLNSERLKKLTESYVVSNQKIKTALGIDKLPLSAEEGLVKTIKSFSSR